MWQRGLVTALALTYLICVLSQSGVQKEDLDASTLQKLKQHNVNLDDLNNDTVHRECLANSNVEPSSNRQAASTEPTSPTGHLMATESTMPKSRELHVNKKPEVEFINYLETAPVQPVKKLGTDVDDSMPIDVYKDTEEQKVTTIAHTTTTIRNVVQNNSLLNPENLMKFLTMYSKFQQSQMDSKVHKEPTTTTPQIEPRTEKNNIFHITINKYIRNESFLDQYYANHQNKIATTEQPNSSSNHIMEKINYFISKSLFTNKDEASRDSRDVNNHETTQENPAHKSNQDRKEDKTTLLNNMKTFHEGHEITKTILNEIPQKALEEIAREVQDLVMKGFIETTSKPLVITPNVVSAINTDINGRDTDKTPSVLIRNVVDDVKKMIMSELWKESALKNLVITSTTAKTATSKETLSSTNKPESTDPELNNFIKLFKKFKSWIDTSSSSSKEENFKAASSKKYFKTSEAVYKSSAVKKSKSKGKRHQTKAFHTDEFIPPQLNDSSEHADPLNPNGYPKLHEKNEIEDEQMGPDANLGKALLPYRDFHSGKKNHKKTDVTTDVSMENLTLNENYHLKNKHTRNKVTQRLEKKLHLKGEVSDSNSIEIKYPIKNTGTKNQEISLKRMINLKRGFDNKLDPEYTNNYKNENSDDEEVLNSESTGDVKEEPVSKLIQVRSRNKNSKLGPNSKSNKKNAVHKRPINYSKENIEPQAGHKISRASDGKLNVFHQYETTKYPGKNQIRDLERLKSFEQKQLDKNFEDQEEGIKNNSGTVYKAYVPQEYTSSSVVTETNMPYNEHPVYNKILDQNKIGRNNGFLRNTPASAYKQYGMPNYAVPNQKTPASENIPNQMLPYPYAIPTYSINKKPEYAIETQNQQHISNANSASLYNPYGFPIYSPVSIIGNAQERMRGAEVNQPPTTGEQGASNYSGKNVEDSPNQITVGATAGNNAISNGYQGAPNYSAQNKIGSIQEAALGNKQNPNYVATYPYGAPQYSETNKPGDTKSSPVNLPKQQTASNPYGVPNYSADNIIGEIQGPIPASSLANIITNAGLANPFGGIFSAKIKFPVIQDPRVEAPMKNPNLNVGPSLNPYLPKINTGIEDTNGQRLMAVSSQNPYLRERQEFVSVLVPNDATLQNGAQSNPHKKPTILYRGRQDIVSPGVVTNSMNDAYVPVKNPYTDAQQIASSAYGSKQPIDMLASGSNDANLPKVKGIQPEPVHLPPSKNENAYNTIAKIYPPRSTKQNDKTSPIMIQTNDDEIMPLGIPIHIKGESKFHMRLIQNQHIIVTTTSRPRSIVDHWNDYVLSRDSNQEKKKAKHIAPARNHHHNKSRPPMTHHDFEDLAAKQEPNDFYRYESKGMRPISEHDIKSRPPNAAEHFSNGQYYNTEMQEDRYPTHRFEKADFVFRNQERMHDSINSGHLTIAQRHQIPLKRPRANFDDTHFQNFLKTQEKVNEMLERILATRPKNLSLEPLKSR